MAKITEQLKTWQGEFGNQYVERNAQSLKELDEMYMRYFGVTRTAMNQDFLGELSRDIKILEVGSNVGNQLHMLQKMGFKNLYGIEINQQAVELSRKRTQHLNIIQGSAFDIPFKDKYFDLVFTSGVLIHIHPNDVKDVLSEIHRLSKEYIWGCEYYADTYTEGGNYRGHDNLFWKTNFSKLYTDSYKDLSVIKEKKYKYQDSDNVDVMYLIRKK